jgi:hypothetical protein
MFAFICVFCLIPAGCGKDKSPTTSGATYPFKVTIDTVSSDINLGTLPITTIENEKTIKISDLVDTETITEPDNYAYRLIGSDGFYAHSKGSPDNTWSHIQKGSIILSTMAVSLDPTLGLANRYNVKGVAEMKILRKIDFVSPSDSLFQNIVAELLAVTFQDSLKTVTLASIIPDGVLASPTTLNYQLIASDNYSVTLTWQQVQEGYYVPGQDRVLYSNPNNPGNMKVTKLNRMVARNP